MAGLSFHGLFAISSFSQFNLLIASQASTITYPKVPVSIIISPSCLKLCQYPELLGHKMISNLGTMLYLLRTIDVAQYSSMPLYYLFTRGLFKNVVPDSIGVQSEIPRPDRSALRMTKGHDPEASHDRRDSASQ